MTNHVSLQISLSRVGFPANEANVRTRPGVDFDVGPELAVAVAVLLADDAEKWAVAGHMVVDGMNQYLGQICVIMHAQGALILHRTVLTFDVSYSNNCVINAAQ